MLEGKFNLNLQKSIKRTGVFCYKTADRFHAGVPDLYVCNATWIESKVIKVGSQNRTIDVPGKMNTDQHNFCKDLIDSGDRVLFCARIEWGKRKFLMLEPYLYMKHRMWKVNDLTMYPEIKSEKNYDVGHIFGKRYESRLNTEWYFK